jgi:hypothetical protein
MTRGRARIATTVAWVIVAATAPAARAQSQASTGQIAGCITDSNGNPLDGVTVIITSVATGARRDLETNDRGCYVAPLLPVGSYEVTAARDGFLTGKTTVLQVTVGAVVTVNLPLQLGTSQNVIVTPTRSPLDVTSPVLHTTFDTAVIAALPTNGHRFQDLFVLMPGAQVDIQRGQLALSGQRGIYANISIDGADYNQPYFGGIRGGSRSNFAPTIPMEAIGEFAVTASGYSPEFGRSPGGVVNVVTRSGTNRPSGTGFYLNRPGELAELNVFGQEAAPTQHQWGGSFGGPIQRNRSFAFVAYEQQNINAPRGVLFPLLQNVTPTADTQEAFDYYKSLERPFTETNDAVALLGRTDWQLTTASRITLRYGASRNAALNAISSGNSTPTTRDLALSSNGTERDRTQTAAGQFTQARRAGLLFELRAQYSREVRERVANAVEARVQNEIGRYGTTSFLGPDPTRTTDWRGQTVANLTLLKGSHTFRGGTEINYVLVDELVGMNQTGAFTLNGLPAATALELMSVRGPTPNRFDSTLVSYMRQIGNLRHSRGTTELALFLQDSWRARPDLTLTYGLRWEGQWHPSPEANNTALINLLAGFTFPSGRKVDPTAIPDAVRAPAPRGGFSWDVRGDATTLVRGHAGIYDARSPGLIFTVPHTNFRVPPSDLSVQLPFRSATTRTIYQQLKLIDVDLNAFPLDRLPIITPQQIEQIGAALGIPVDQYQNASVFVIDSGFKNPRAYQWSVGLERALGPGVIVGADYHDVRTINLERNIDLNLPSPFVRDPAIDPAQRPFFGLRAGGEARPIPSLNQITVRESTARSRYRALTLRTRVRQAWGEFTASYVLSKSLSDDDNEADAGGMVAENAYDLAPEYSFARLDRRHQLTGAGIWRLPFAIEAAAAFQFRSAVPIDVRVGADVNEDRSNAVDRPYRAPGLPFERHAFRNRPVSTVDLHLRKDVTVALGRRLSFLFDVYNVFNVDGLQYAGTDVTTFCATPASTCGFDGPTNPNFLQIRDQQGNYLLSNTPGEPRQVQLGLRFSF